MAGETTVEVPASRDTGIETFRFGFGWCFELNGVMDARDFPTEQEALEAARASRNIPDEQETSEKQA